MKEDTGQEGEENGIGRDMQVEVDQPVQPHHQQTDSGGNPHEAVGRAVFLAGPDLAPAQEVEDQENDHQDACQQAAFEEPFEIVVVGMIDEFGNVAWLETTENRGVGAEATADRKNFADALDGASKDRPAQIVGHSFAGEAAENGRQADLERHFRCLADAV